MAVTISIDTEEDNWGFFGASGATTDKIQHLTELQDVFDRFGARPTYRQSSPATITLSIVVLGELASRKDVEIGAHCHPWNTHPSTGEDPENSMMCKFSTSDNRRKIHEITGRIRSELGVSPTSFRAGRWGFGPSVAEAPVAEGFRVDCSVSPFVDWSNEGGADFRGAPHHPYRFDPASPFLEDPRGPLVELPTTIGFLGGNHRRSSILRERLMASPLRRLKVLGVLDRLDLSQRRWLSPETSTAAELKRLAEAWVDSGELPLGFTFHSSTLLPGHYSFRGGRAGSESFPGHHR